MIGQRLSHYRVMEEPSRGGIGIVYCALDVKLDREVALKVLPAELVAGPESKRRRSTTLGQLFFRNGDKIMAVAITTQPRFSAGAPQMLFEGKYFEDPDILSYDVTPHGQRFVMIREEDASAPRHLHVILNWFEELKRLVPTN